MGAASMTMDQQKIIAVSSPRQNFRRVKDPYN
jgi:hypothetical protein